MSKINNTQIDNIKHTDAVMSMYKVVEYTDNYSKISLLIILLVIVLGLDLNKN